MLFYANLTIGGLRYLYYTTIFRWCQEVIILYTAKLTRERIKNLCKSKRINMETMLKHYSLGVNAIRQINNKTGIASFSLAKIADYLDCSVDYLLGRTDNPISHKIPVKRNISVSPSNDTELQVAYGFKSGPVIEDDDETTTSK